VSVKEPRNLEDDMEAPQFTPEEKRILYRILARPSRGKDGFFFYAVFIFPSLIIAVYGVWNSDFARSPLKAMGPFRKQQRSGRYVNMSYAVGR